LEWSSFGIGMAPEWSIPVPRLRGLSGLPRIDAKTALQLTPIMKSSLDPKSALIGLGLGVLTTLVIGAAASPGTAGRYQIGATGNHGLVLDTATGQVWSGYFGSHGGGTDGNFFRPKLGEKK
jgi:hypothetical protein